MDEPDRIAVLLRKGASARFGSVFALGFVFGVARGKILMAVFFGVFTLFTAFIFWTADKWWAHD